MTGNGAGNGARSGYALGWLLRRYRTAAGLTQEELAHQAGLSVRALSNLENGRTTRPFPSSVRLLADALALGAPARAQLMESLTAIRADEAAADIPPVSFQDGVGPPPVVPLQLPAPVSQFAGRAAELRRLNGLLEHALGSGAVVISAIGGPPGWERPRWPCTGRIRCRLGSRTVSSTRTCAASIHPERRSCPRR